MRRFDCFLLVLVFVFSLIIINLSLVSAEPGRLVSELSGEGWKLWRDTGAKWMDDELFLPPVDVSRLPVNPPTCGWDRLDETYDRIVSVPGTVEEHFWAAHGNSTGIAGDYRGVSWWTRTFHIDSSLRGKRIILAFESVNLRAEIFVNNKLVGYDIIGNTPFEVDATAAVKFGAENRLSIRITDPIGNFDWSDNDLFRWGRSWIPPVRGFGGITGRIFLHATDAVRIDDIYVRNKPKIKDVEIFITIGNSAGRKVNGTLTVTIHEWKKPSRIIWKKTISQNIPSKGKECSVNASVSKAKPWSIEEPDLYITKVSFESSDGEILDTFSQRFGFRFFYVGEKDGDKRFYLNGKRIFLFSAMGRGYWPKNGIFPTPEMAGREGKMLKKLGFNMFCFHRAIGNPPIIRVGDECGFFSYQEPGGYRCMPEPNEMAKEWRREKVRRWVIRDRSHPSMIIYNFKNEARKEPDEDDRRNMRMVHKLDPSRILTYNSDRNRNLTSLENRPDDPVKLHMLPFDNTMYTHGWWDHHHWIREAGYLDEHYNHPRFYLRLNIVRGDSINFLKKDEIIFYGEEGAFGTMVRLEKIKNELMRTGATGWREAEIIDWFNMYDRFLDDSGFRTAFPTVDDLTLSMGRNMHYFHGRILENARISNIIDCYNLNGWSPAATHTDLVDTYRNPTADPAILSHYSQPLYIAVKIRDKVLEPGKVPIADFFIVNEVDLKGSHTLNITFKGPDEETLFEKSFKVRITGGEEFGELLIERVVMPPVKSEGYYMLTAELIDRRGNIKTTGFDDIYVADYMNGPGISGKGAVIDESGTINSFLKKTRSISFPEFDPNGSDLDYIIVGKHDWNKVRKHYRAIMDRVLNGARLVIVDGADSWAREIDRIYYFQAIRYAGSRNWGNRGRLFVGSSKFLEGLPGARGMNWEYQVFYSGRVWGLEMDHRGSDLIVALGAEHRPEILSAASCIPFGNGSIILSTLNIILQLESNTAQSSVAKRLFLNFLEIK